MTDIKNEFQQAATDVQNLAKRPSNDELLSLYALYKQAQEGDVSGKKPGLLDIKGKAKYNAWTEIKGMDNETAMKKYITLVGKLKKQYA